MDLRYETELALRYLRGDAEVSAAVNAYVNAMIDGGEFVPGYELAVGDFDRDGLRELMALFMARIPAGEDGLRRVSQMIVDRTRLRQSGYVVVDADNVVIADGYQVLRLTSGTQVWRTPRISVDGILDLCVRGGVVSGQWCQPTVDGEVWRSFAVDYASGALLPGTVIR